MEKIIFFGLVIPIMAYVLYLGGMAIMNGFKSKEANIRSKVITRINWRVCLKNIFEKLFFY